MLFPWTKLERGQAFFIPALDLAPVREQGLLAAVPLRLNDARARYAIKDGMLGVLFYRLPFAQPLRSGSLPP